MNKAVAHREWCCFSKRNIQQEAVNGILLKSQSIALPRNDLPCSKDTSFVAEIHITLQLHSIKCNDLDTNITNIMNAR